MATQIKRTKKFKALIAAGLDENQALKALGHEPAVEGDPRIQTLLDAGFTQAQAVAALKSADEATAEKSSQAVNTPLTSKEKGEALVAKHGLVFTKGRVYVTPDIIEAAVRVRKNGNAEVIQSSGVGRTKAVLIFREDSGDVAIQNLTKPA